MPSNISLSSLDYFGLRKVHSIENFRLSASTTSSFNRFKHTVHKVTVSTDSAVIIGFKDSADPNSDIRLQAGQSLTLDDVEVDTVSAITSSGSANVDVIGLRRVR